MTKTLVFVILPLLVITVLWWRKQLTARRLRKREEEGFADPEQLAELLDDWNRKHRPDLFGRGGDWPTGKNSGMGYYAVASAKGSHT